MLKRKWSKQRKINQIAKKTKRNIKPEVKPDIINSNNRALLILGLIFISGFIILLPVRIDWTLITVRPARGHNSRKNSDLPGLDNAAGICYSPTGCESLKPEVSLPSESDFDFKINDPWEDLIPNHQLLNEIQPNILGKCIIYNRIGFRGNMTHTVWLMLHVWLTQMIEMY